MKFTIKKTRVFDSINYLLLFLLVGVSSIPFFIGNNYLLLGFGLSFLIFFFRKLKLEQYVLIYSSVFVIISICHVFFFNFFDAPVFFGLIVRIFFAYFTIKIIGKNIENYYINLLYFLSVFSLIIWGVLFAVPSSFNFFIGSVTPFFEKLTLYKPCEHHMIFFTFNIGKGIVPRNSGPFWEPGGFGIFLIIAFILNLLKTNSVLDKKNIIFLFALLTTQSTGSYMAFAILMVFYFISQKKLRYLLIALPAFLVLFYTYFEKLDFLEEKIVNEFEFIEGSSTTHLPRTRLVSALEDWKIIKEFPLFGEGRFKEEESEFSNQGLNYRNNGTTRLAAEFGILGFLFYFYFMYKSFKVLCRHYGFKDLFALSLVVVIIVAGISQIIFTKTFFIALTFMFFVKSKYLTKPNHEIGIEGSFKSF